MTTPEHTLVGIHVAFALGFHRQLGWTAVAMAGLASNIPDWDGLPMLFDMQRFEGGHRVWGHNVLAIVLSSLLLGWTQFKYSWLERIQNRLARRFLSLKTAGSEMNLTERRVGTSSLISVAILAQALHLPCDMVVSGGNGLSDWETRPFWPFSNTGFVYPMIPWGDVGPTLILMLGIIAIAKWKNYFSRVSWLTLFALVSYLFLRAWARGILAA